MNERLNLRFKAIIILLELNTLWISCTRGTDTFYTHDKVTGNYTVFVMDVPSEYLWSSFNSVPGFSRIIKFKEDRQAVTEPKDGTLLTGDAKTLFEGIVNKDGVEILEVVYGHELSQYYNMADITTVDTKVNQFEYYDVYLQDRISILQINTTFPENSNMYFETKSADPEMVKCYKNAQSDGNFYYKRECRHKSDLLAIQGDIKTAIDPEGTWHLILKADHNRHPVYVETMFQSDINCGNDRISIESRCQSTDDFDTVEYKIEEKTIFSTVFKKPIKVLIKIKSVSKPTTKVESSLFKKIEGCYNEANKGLVILENVCTNLSEDYEEKLVIEYDTLNANVNDKLSNIHIIRRKTKYRLLWKKKVPHNSECNVGQFFSDVLGIEKCWDLPGGFDAKKHGLVLIDALPLILGITIPLALLLVAGIVFIAMKCKNMNKDKTRQNSKIPRNLYEDENQNLNRHNADCNENHGNHYEDPNLNLNRQNADGNENPERPGEGGNDGPGGSYEAIGGNP